MVATTPKALLQKTAAELARWKSTDPVDELANAQLLADALAAMVPSATIVHHPMVPWVADAYNVHWDLAAAGVRAAGIGEPITPPYLLLDTFTDTNGTLITAHTPDGTSTGGAWSTFGSTVEAQIDSNQLQTRVLSAGAFSGASYELPSGTEDFTVTMEGNYQNDSGFVNMGLRVRGPEQLSLGQGYWVGFAENVSRSLVIRTGTANGAVQASTAMAEPADDEAFTLTVVVTGDTIDATWVDTTNGTVNVVYASATARDGDWVAPYARGINLGSYICNRIEVT